MRKMRQSRRKSRRGPPPLSKLSLNVRPGPSLPTTDKKCPELDRELFDGFSIKILRVCPEQHPISFPEIRREKQLQANQQSEAIGFPRKHAYRDLRQPCSSQPGSNPIPTTGFPARQQTQQAGGGRSTRKLLPILQYWKQDACAVETYT